RRHAASLVEQDGEVGQIVGGVDVVHERADALDAELDPGAGGRLDVPFEAAGTEAGPECGGRLQQECVRAGPAAIGHDHGVELLRARACEHPVDLQGV